MSSEIRQQRVAGLLFEELSIMLAGELADPRISLVTVTDVRVSKDLRNARIVPELIFSYDDTPAKVARVDDILRQIAAERSQKDDAASTDGRQ